MHRLFVAIRPPAEIRRTLLDLMGGILGARWQDDGQLHITLRFVGEVDRHCADDLAAALGEIHFQPFEIALAGLGQFDRKGRIDTLWAGVQPRDQLTQLHQRIDRACTNAGLRADERAYLPHITVARFGRTAGPMDDFITAHGGLTSAPFTVDGFALFESHLGHEGAAYHIVERYRAA